MNIFALDMCPKKSASMLTRTHIVKMTLESAQLLCTAVNVVTESNIAPYKSTHINHPCSKWVRESKSNYDWLVDHGLSIAERYFKWRRREHASQKVIEWCGKLKLSIPDLGLTPFALAMPDKYKQEDPVKSYIDYYNSEKRKR